MDTLDILDIKERGNILYNNYNLKESIKPEEILMYLRKSRADDPLLSVSDVLSKHEEEIDRWVEHNLSAAIPESNRFREVVSGESLSARIEFQKILKLVEQPSIKAVIVKEISRMGRPDTMEIGMISKILRYTNTIVISVSPFRVFNLADKFEREMFENELKQGNNLLEYNKVILRDGRERSARSGNYLGSKPPYGYDKITIVEEKRKCPTLAIKEEQANIVRMIFNAYVNENIGTQAIANRLNDLQIKSPRGNLWSADSIRTVLENPHYIGMVRWNDRKAIVVVEDGEFRKTRPKTPEGEKIFTEGRHEAIISEELFRAAQEKRGRSHKTCSNKELRNPLASILFCECGRAMSYRHSTRGNLKYREPRLVCNGQHRCGNGACSVSELVDFMVMVLKQKISEFETEVTQGNTHTDDFHEKLIKSLEKKLSDIGAREISLWESQVNPDPAVRMPSHVFQALTDKLVKEREETEHALTEAHNAVETRVDYRTAIVTLQNALDALLDDEVSVSEKNKLLKACIQRITYHRDVPQRILGKGTGRQWTCPPIELDVKLKV